MKKLLIYLSVIVVLFAVLFVLNRTSTTTADNADNVYGIKASKLHPETREQLDNPNYQNIILPEQLKTELGKKGGLFVYFFSPTCPHCKLTTPVLMPIAKEMNVDVKQFNLLEFPEGWQEYNIEYTPTLVYYKDGKEIKRTQIVDGKQVDLLSRMEGGVEEHPGDGGYTEQDFRDFFNKYKNQSNK
ncbi:thioredoxin family protein [Ferviditalea candida]|uniref:Thioredoxin family protein n=1 Tax=Ferviditalea candida TaxID=3108399 RepID=A0ABU5ZCI5_9BACL|nr:thioredoxin family protein [Paenibacillaceae bacterium T2]